MASEPNSEASAQVIIDDPTPCDNPGSSFQAYALAKRFQATDADFTLLSSDGVSFKVHKYHLIAASTVLRELLDLDHGGATGPKPSITFVDPVTESAGSLSIFLSLMYGTTLIKAQHRFVIPCIDFLRKYDCQLALNSLRTLIRAQLIPTGHDGMNPYRIFQAAAQLDDHITCSEAIRRGGEQHWNRKSECPGERCIHQFLPNRSMFDPATMGVKDMEMIPPAYFLALMRAVDAARPPSKDGPTQSTWNTAAKEFRKILELPRDEAQLEKQKRDTRATRGGRGRGQRGRRGHLVL